MIKLEPGDDFTIIQQEILMMKVRGFLRNPKYYLFLAGLPAREYRGVLRVLPAAGQALDLHGVLRRRQPPGGTFSTFYMFKYLCIFTQNIFIYLHLKYLCPGYLPHHGAAVGEADRVHVPGDAAGAGLPPLHAPAQVRAVSCGKWRGKTNCQLPPIHL